MKIEKYAWNDDFIYKMISPFAMSSKVIDEIGPITTNENTEWYFVADNSEIKAFAGVESTNVSLKIKNFYSLDGDFKHFEKLAKHIIKEFKASKHAKLYCFSNNDNLKKVQNLGFKFSQKNVEWHRMVIEK